jgi:geranylgeranyl pyrophosphate synthase
MLERHDPERLHDPDRFLAEVEKRLATAFEGPTNGASNGVDHPAGASVLEEAARHLCLADGAKRTRPRLVQLFAKAVSAPPDVAVDVAVSAELIHAASLLHDDVIDEGSQRRGQPTANRVWGNLAAVLAGDLILSRAIQRLLRWPRPVSEGALAVVVEMSCAAITEAERRYQAPIAAKTWRQIAEGKTGALLGWCGQAVAVAGEDEEAARRFGTCGRHLGIAYQLADDIWDFEGLKGKDPLQDLKNGNPSYVLARACELEPALAPDLVAFWAQGAPEETCRALAARIERGGALDAARRTVSHEIEAALSALGPYAERPGGEDIERWSRLLQMSFQTTPSPAAEASP